MCATRPLRLGGQFYAQAVKVQHDISKPARYTCILAMPQWEDVACPPCSCLWSCDCLLHSLWQSPFEACSETGSGKHWVGFLNRQPGALFLVAFGAVTPCMV
jgi:hypothetical protein